MSEAPDPLEAELAALHPRPVSPELRDRVADRLTTPPARRRWVWAVALAGVLASAAAIVLVAPWRKDVPAPEPPAVVPPTPAATESPDPAPSVLAYRRALARSPEDLDALLDQQGSTNPTPAAVAAGPFTVNAFLGDD